MIYSLHLESFTHVDYVQIEEKQRITEFLKTCVYESNEIRLWIKNFLTDVIIPIQVKNCENIIRTNTEEHVISGLDALNQVIECFELKILVGGYNNDIFHHVLTEELKKLGCLPMVISVIYNENDTANCKLYYV